MRHALYLCLCACVTLAGLLPAAPAPAAEPAGLCTGFGPQTPRDIDKAAGTNARTFAIAPAAQAMNLCNIHFHKGAEHKASAFATALPGASGKEGGYACAIAGSLSAAERAPAGADVCGGLRPGDTVEVHWVFTSCDVAPGPTLGACLSPACANPQLRVEAQVFTLVNDRGGLDFGAFAATGRTGGTHQPKALPTGTGTPVQFLGSTTGPSYDDRKCSPFQVTWSVRPACAKLDIASLGAFCKGNPFKEDHAHGVRKLVTAPSLLAPIR